jgi:hypothetical protein
MPRFGFEPTIPVFERAKTVHALDRAATAIGTIVLLLEKLSVEGNEIKINLPATKSVYKYFCTVSPHRKFHSRIN